jgi:hypothetical protein
VGLILERTGEDPQTLKQGTAPQVSASGDSRLHQRASGVYVGLATAAKRSPRARVRRFGRGALHQINGGKFNEKKESSARSLIRDRWLMERQEGTNARQESQMELSASISQIPVPNLMSRYEL